MALKYKNYRTKEVVVAETEPHIAALWGSSDRGPNANQGQDFGWRLAPEVVVQLNDIKRNPATMVQIASMSQKGLADVSESDVLTYISSLSDESQAPVASDEDYDAEYRQEIANEALAKKEAELAEREAALAEKEKAAKKTTDKK